MNRVSGREMSRTGLNEKIFWSMVGGSVIGFGLTSIKIVKLSTPADILTELGFLALLGLVFWYAWRLRTTIHAGPGGGVMIRTFTATRHIPWRQVLLIDEELLPGAGNKGGTMGGVVYHLDEQGAPHRSNMPWFTDKYANLTFEIRASAEEWLKHRGEEWQMPPGWREFIAAQKTRAKLKALAGHLAMIIPFELVFIGLVGSLFVGFAVSIPLAIAVAALTGWAVWNNAKKKVAHSAER